MYISEEMIREVQKRIEVSYEEAELYLRRAKGDINHAVYLISKKRNSSWERFKSAINDILNNLIQYRFIITRRERVILDVPLLLLIILIFIDDFYSHLFPLFVIFIVILLTECKVKLEREEGKQDKKHKAQNRNNPSRDNQVTQPVNYHPDIKVELKNKGEETPVQKENGDDDYYEIIVEK